MKDSYAPNPAAMILFALSLLFIAWLSSVAYSEEPTVEQWIRAGKTESALRAEWLQAQMIHQRAVREGMRKNRVPIKGPDWQMRFYKKQLYQLPGWLPPLLSSDRVGSLGYLKSGEVSTTSVNVGDQKKPMEIQLRTFSARLISIKLVQIIDPSKALVNFESDRIKSAHYMLSIPTKGLVDGKNVVVEQPVFISGTETYDTIKGSNTVFKIKPFDPVWALDKSLTQPPVPELKDWSDVSNQFTANARLIDLDLKVVTLEKADGQVITIPISKLSKKDREYAAKHLGDD